MTGNVYVVDECLLCCCHHTMLALVFPAQVAFPDVTARNRVVQVRSYEERTARKLSEAFPGAPLPKVRCVAWHPCLWW